MNFIEEEVSILNRIIDYIEQNLVVNSENDEDLLSVKKISKALNMSSSNLQLLFNNGCPITIHEYIVKRRMTLASHDLVESTESIMNIAQKYGYSSDSFTKVFKKTYGATPSEYRKNGGPKNDFKKYNIKITDITEEINSIPFVEHSCANCVFCMPGNNTLVCSGRSNDYGTPIEKMIKRFPAGCEEFEYTLDAFVENEQKKEIFMEELFKIAESI